MKKIIKGKRYDTSTAKFIAAVYNGEIGSFSEYEARLYKKKTGEFFLYEYGGPMSRMAVNISDNEVSGSENITPLVVEEAKKWLEENDLPDDYEKLFEAREGMSLKELRERKGLTQMQLSELTEIPLRTIQKYESGELDINSVKGITLYRLAKELDCEIENLLNL